MIIPVIHNSNDNFFSTCVSKLQSQMLITITNSNSSPEVNSSEVFTQITVWIACVYAKNIQKHLVGGGAYVTFVFSAHMCLYTNLFLLSRIHILKMNVQSSFKLQIFLSCVRSDHSKDELQSSLQLLLPFLYSA